MLYLRGRSSSLISFEQRSSADISAERDADNERSIWNHNNDVYSAFVDDRRRGLAARVSRSLAAAAEASVCIGRA